LDQCERPRAVSSVTFLNKRTEAVRCPHNVIDFDRFSSRFEMFFRAALVVVLMLASSHQSIADSSFAGDCERTIVTGVIIGKGTEPRETMQLSNPVPDPLDDVHGGRERNPHCLQLMRIAIAISLGNRDVVEIASGELGKFGVTREEIQHFVDWTKLHSGPVSLGPPKAGC
jgi:hypothetical protein